MVVRDDDADDYDVGSHESNHDLATNTNHTSSRSTPQVLDVTIMTQKSGLFAKWQLDHVTLLDMGNGKECVDGPVLNFFIYLHQPLQVLVPIQQVGSCRRRHGPHCCVANVSLSIHPGYTDRFQLIGWHQQRNSRHFARAGGQRRQHVSAAAAETQV